MSLISLYILESSGRYGQCSVNSLRNSPRLTIRGCTHFRALRISICLVKCEPNYQPIPNALSFCRNGSFSEVNCNLVEEIVESCELVPVITFATLFTSLVSNLFSCFIAVCLSDSTSLRKRYGWHAWRNNCVTLADFLQKPTTLLRFSFLIPILFPNWFAFIYFSNLEKRRRRYPNRANVSPQTTFENIESLWQP